MKITRLTRPRDSHWIALRGMGILLVLSLLAASNMIGGLIPRTLASSPEDFYLSVELAEPKGQVFVVEIYRSYFRGNQGGYEIVETRRVGFDEAVALLRRQVASPPAEFSDEMWQSQTYSNLARVYRVKGLHERAIEVLKEGAARYPRYWSFLKDLAVEYAAAKQYADAIGALNRAASLLRLRERAHGQLPGWIQYDLAVLYMKDRDYDGAIQVLTGLIQENPRTSYWPEVRAHYALGHAYLEISQYDKAIEFLKRATDLGDPQAERSAIDELYPPTTLADVSKELQVAYQKWTEVLAKSRELVEQGRRAEQAGQFREALKHYASLLQFVSPGSEQERDARERIIKTVQNLAPPPAIPEGAHQHLVYGVTATKEAKTSAHFENAVREFRKALRLAPWWADAYLNLAIAQEGAGKYADAAKSLGFFLLAAPNDPEAKRLRNKIYELEYKAKATEKK